MTSKIITITAALLLLISISAEGQSRSANKSAKQKNRISLEMLDRQAPMNVVSENTDSLIELSGFDKPLNSNYETFFLRNNGSANLLRLWITLDYTSVDNTPLHSRKETVRTDIPADNSRQISIRTFDRQHSFYYYRSRIPRTEQGVAPFKVRITIDSIGFAQE